MKKKDNLIEHRLKVARLFGDIMDIIGEADLTTGEIFGLLESLKFAFNTLADNKADRIVEELEEEISSTKNVS